MRRPCVPWSWSWTGMSRWKRGSLGLGLRPRYACNGRRNSAVLSLRWRWTSRPRRSCWYQPAARFHPRHGSSVHQKSAYLLTTELNPDPLVAPNYRRQPLTPPTQPSPRPPSPPLSSLQPPTVSPPFRPSLPLLPPSRPSKPAPRPLTAPPRRGSARVAPNHLLPAPPARSQTTTRRSAQGLARARAPAVWTQRVFSAARTLRLARTWWRRNRRPAPHVTGGGCRVGWWALGAGWGVRDRRGMRGRRKTASAAGGEIHRRWLLGDRVGKGWRRGFEKHRGGRRRLRGGLDGREAVWECGEIPVMPDCIFRDSESSQSGGLE